jgi:3-oxoacyl-[acyl-carrier protein] reductase
MITENTARSVLITGGNRGIGLSIAERFLADGHRVAVTSRSGEGPRGSLIVPADVADYESVKAAGRAAEDAHGPVEVLVANAGVTNDVVAMMMTEEDFTSVIDINLAGAFRAVRSVLPGMIKARYGRIVLVASVVGLWGSPGQANYAASKSGLIGLARSVAREVGTRNITVNVIAPGFVETDMTAGLSAEVRARYEGAIPAGRFAQAEEITGAVAWLASEEAAYVTGAVIPVDGGLGMGH